MAETNARPPRDGLVRAQASGALRLVHDGARAQSDEGGSTLTGRFAVFNQWTEIRSVFEGHFLERIAPGAFRKTFREQRPDMKVLFNHGHDPQVGDKPLGPIEDLREDDEGAFYDVPLLDTSYNRDLKPGLEKGLYGASFRFRVMREDYNEEPERSDSNPDGIPERTIKEAQVMEFGPVTFPAYPGATAGLRSATDDFLIAQFADHPERFRDLVRENPDLRSLLEPIFVREDDEEHVEDVPTPEPEPARDEVPASSTPGPSPTLFAGPITRPPRKETAWKRPRSRS